MSLADNLHRVYDQIASACANSGRSPDKVALVAVSKTHPAEAVLEAYAAGQRLFGENRMQETQGKLPVLAGLTDLELHLIGPLQSNKTAKAAEMFSAVQTVDSLKIAERLNKACVELGKTLPVFVEVKLSHEAAKHGLAPEELGVLLESVAALDRLELRGLMTVPPYTEDAEGARPYFRRLRELRDAHRERFPRLSELSMGMSHDFTVAIEEGSTLVRVGTAIFGSRSYA